MTEMLKCNSPQLMASGRGMGGEGPSSVSIGGRALLSLTILMEYIDIHKVIVFLVWGEAHKGGQTHSD